LTVEKSSRSFLYGPYVNVRIVGS